MTELKPCPFCGSSKVKLINPQTLGGDYKYTVVCVSCEIGIVNSDYGLRLYEGWKDAVRAWNGRTKE